MRKGLRKLQINKETLKMLSAPQLSRVAGEYPATAYTCDDWCNSTRCTADYTCISACPVGC
jgi:hypothetical protein